MSEQVAYDDAVETSDGASVDPVVSDGGSESDNYGEMQSRMAGDDNPWYSESEGKVVDKDGAIITDPATGNAFTSQEAFDTWMKEKQAEHQQKLTATPKTTPVESKPMARSFDSFIGSDLTPDKIQKLAEVGKSYKYSDELVPKVEAVQADGKQAEPELDPIEKVKADRKNWEAITVQPLREVRQLLIDQGADPSLVDNLLNPILQKQNELVENQYKSDYEKAMIAKLDGKYSPTISKFEAEKLTQASNANIERLARQYYPEGGKDAFFALVNGHCDEKGVFTRGPAAVVVDFATALAANGKTYKSAEERAEAYANTFRSLTADPAKASALADIAHYYWLGKQAITANKLGYEKGKQVAQQDNQRIQKTIKTRPASYAAPSTAQDTDGMPDMLRMALGIGRR